MDKPSLKALRELVEQCLIPEYARERDLPINVEYKVIEAVPALLAIAEAARACANADLIRDGADVGPSDALLAALALVEE